MGRRKQYFRFFFQDLFYNAKLLISFVFFMKIAERKRGVMEYSCPDPKGWKIPYNAPSATHSSISLYLYYFIRIGESRSSISEKGELTTPPYGHPFREGELVISREVGGGCMTFFIYIFEIKYFKNCEK